MTEPIRCGHCTTTLHFKKLGRRNFYYCPNDKCQKYGVVVNGHRAGKWNIFPDKELHHV